MISKLLSIFFINCFFATSISSLSSWKIVDEDVDYVISKFHESDTVHRVYKEFNEGSYFDDIYKRFTDNYEEDGIKTFQGKEFRNLSEEEYIKLVNILNIFDVSIKEDILERERQTRIQIFNILFWTKLAGCPFLVVNQDRSFFYHRLHIYTPEYARTMREQSGQVFECYPYEKDCTVVGIRKGNDNSTYRTRKVTSDLKDNAVIYRYLNAHKTAVDIEKYHSSLSESDGSIYSEKNPEISYDFLEDYIVSPYNISYMREVLLGLSNLSKPIVNLMRGKAIYLSSQNGVSVNLFMTSHNAPVVSYLGFMPGIFIEHNPALPDNNVSMTHRAVIQMVGYLLDTMVLRDTSETRDIKTIMYPSFLSDNLSFLELKKDKENLFRKREGYVLEKENDLKKTHRGYMTSHAESSSKADFAEHFTYYVLFRKLFEAAAIEERETDELLSRKFEFMNRLFSLDTK